MLNLTMYEDAADAMRKLAADNNAAVLLAGDDESKLVRFFGNNEELTFSIVMTGLFQMFRVILQRTFFTEEEMQELNKTVSECLGDMNEVVKGHGEPN